jgi:23S rRNA pseudouridine1911/1915/1917 synthase
VLNESGADLNTGCVYRDLVDVAAIGWTVEEFYSRRYNHSTPEQWRERISAGQVQLNGAPVSADTRLIPGQRLSYRRAPWSEPPVPLDFRVVYDDEDVLVVDKPAGLPVQPGGGFLEHTLLRLVARRTPGDAPIPIHRLGRGTSGLLLLARSPQARASLSAQMREHRLLKVYRALVVGAVQPDDFTVVQPIGRVDHPRLGYLWAACDSGLPSRSAVRVLGRDQQTSLVEVTITSGRPHQIRIHLAWAGHPLVGDPLYGPGGIAATDAVPGDCGYLLHACRLGFFHPSDGRWLELHCPPPPALVGSASPV